MKESETEGSSDELEVLPSAAPPRPRTARGLVLAWKQSIYYVPADAVVSLPKKPFMVEDGAALGSLLNTKCADRWLPVCQPEHLLVLKGREGTSCYAILGVSGQPPVAPYLPQ